jgi:hypothetical protein
LQWYAAFGAAHEGAHLLAAWALCGATPSAHNLLRAALARHVVLLAADEDEEGRDERIFLATSSTRIGTLVSWVECNPMTWRAVSIRP